ncbi:hypothetical protein BDN72DRAFT_895995 [Pluteus cervinus]|uniref:Uncharacterized protein n=1 Tax=Pluteus cervinus TaxID=181527 RepID=A0ACD3AZ46_9AGAR|nr:hypothetical protein BDN72DRAFT_895995 [Pluteus cervinus]
MSTSPKQRNSRSMSVNHDQSNISNGREPLTTLPIELWMLIASFLPREDLIRLMGVNRGFFESAMDAKYGKMEFLQSDVGRFMNMLKGLQNPSNVCRVRSIALWPVVVWSVIHETEKVIAPRANTRKSRVLPAFLRALSLSKRHSVAKNDQEATIHQLQHPPPEERKELFLNTLRTLTHIQNLDLHWSTPYLNTPHFSFSVMWECLPMTHLRNLTLQITALQLVRTIETFQPLVNLHSLSLRTWFPRGDRDVVHSLISLVNTTQNSLASLDFDCLSSGYHSIPPLLTELKLPKLTHLSLRLPLNPKHMQHSPHFLSFFHRHKITHLTLAGVHCYDSQSTREIINWLEESVPRSKLGGQVLSTTSLQIKPGFLSESYGQHLIQTLIQTFPNVVDLALSDASLSYLETRVLLDCLAKRRFSLESSASNPNPTLHSFSMFVSTLTPELVALIAEYLPQLRRLTVSVESIAGVDRERLLGNEVRREDKSGSREFYLTLSGWHHYCPGPWKDTLGSWSLEDISIIYWEYGIGRRYAWECMEGVNLCVPSIKSFAGQGHRRRVKDLIPPEE